MRPRTHEADRQLRLTAYGHIIQRYLRYVLIRCTGYTNDKSQVQRMALYALVTACLLFDKLHRLGELGALVEMMVKIVGEDPTPEFGVVDPPGRVDEAGPVFVLDERMCEVAGAINALDQLSRELLVLHHIEGIEVVTLADAHGMSVDDIRKALAEAEGQFIELLRGLFLLGGWRRPRRAQALGGVGGLYRPALGQQPWRLCPALRGPVEQMRVVSSQ